MRTQCSVVMMKVKKVLRKSAQKCYSLMCSQGFSDWILVTNHAPCTIFYLVLKKNNCVYVG
jgi:hypothetical protein